MAKIKINLAGESEEFEAAQGETIVEAAQEAGIATPFGCTSGSCHVCVAKVISGEVDRGEFDTLDDDAKSNNIILTCQAHAKSDEIQIDFDAI